MFSPPNSPAVNDWFRRLDAAWKRMPAEEQTRQREEVGQHLEGLVAANTALGHSDEEAWTAALNQFGDPAQIGRKIYQEWRQSRVGFRADAAAILFGLGLYAVQWLVLEALFPLWIIKFTALHGMSSVHLTNEVESIYFHATGFLIYATIGLRYPFHAIKGAFYTHVLWFLWMWAFDVVFESVQLSSLAHAASVISNPFPASLSIWIICHITVAYLASVTKRGWYRPMLDDFKLTLPRRRQLSL